jgi:hypothetical protein
VEKEAKQPIEEFNPAANAIDELHKAADDKASKVGDVAVLELFPLVSTYTLYHLC